MRSDNQHVYVLTKSQRNITYSHSRHYTEFTKLSFNETTFFSKYGAVYSSHRELALYNSKLNIAELIKRIQKQPPTPGLFKLNSALLLKCSFRPPVLAPIVLGDFRFQVA